MKTWPRSLPTAAVAVLLANAAPVWAGSTLPGGFVEEVLVTSGQAPGSTGIAYEPGSGDLWVLEQGGGGEARVRVRDAVSATVSTALTLDCVDSSGERGLLGIAFHPDYLEGSRFVYLYYTRDFDPVGCDKQGESGSRNQVSRFTESDNELSGEEVILEGPQLTSAMNHNGGTVRFAPDGTLFISMGDNDTDHLPSPLSRDLTDLRGKLLRINDDGSIPDDNPFVGAAGGVREEIWAWGLRNHFRFSIDPVTGTPFIGDVGEANWEAIYAGIPGADYGYPCLEGSHDFQSCDPAPDPDSVTQPIFEYNDDGKTPPVIGNTVIGGPVYRATAFPEEYHDNYFFGDYVNGWIRRGRIGPDFQIVDVEMFVPNATGVVDFAVSPEGCLTWASIIGLGVRDICYDDTIKNQLPLAVASATPTFSLGSVEVDFTGSASEDPDMDTLAFDWDFGDGTGSTSADPTHEYTLDGFYDAVLTVDDQEGADNSMDSAAAIRIVVGNEPPLADATVGIAAAGEKGVYQAGDVIEYSGSATDVQDGTLDLERLWWTIVYEDDAGRSWPLQGPHREVSAGTFTIPVSGLGSLPGSYRVHLTATDLGDEPDTDPLELSDSLFVEFQPMLSDLTLAADPAGMGIELELDGAAQTAPFTEPSVVASIRTLGAPSPQTIGNVTWAFDSWSDGGAAEHQITTPKMETTYTATYLCALEVRSVEQFDDVQIIEGCAAYALGPLWRVNPTGDVTVRATDRIELRNGVRVRSGGRLTLELVGG